MISVRKLLCIWHVYYSQFLRYFARNTIFTEFLSKNNIIAAEPIYIPPADSRIWSLLYAASVSCHIYSPAFEILHTRLIRPASTATIMTLVCKTHTISWPLSTSHSHACACTLILELRSDALKMYIVCTRWSNWSLGPSLVDWVTPHNHFHCMFRGRFQVHMNARNLSNHWTF